MQPEILRQIVEAAIRDQLFLNWRFYILICGISFLTTAAEHWLSSYLKKRGETLATKADMDEILRQISETTRVTEEVRSTVSQADWAAREWRTTRRLKLEELLSATYSLDKWLGAQRSKWLSAEEIVSDEAPMEKIKLLATLYFPELRAETTAVWVAYQEAFLFILKNSNQFLAAKYANDASNYQAATDQFTQGWEPLYNTARLAIVSLEKKASALMIQIAGI